jgi:hypothetical protein
MLAAPGGTSSCRFVLQSVNAVSGICGKRWGKNCTSVNANGTISDLAGMLRCETGVVCGFAQHIFYGSGAKFSPKTRMTGTGERGQTGFAAEKVSLRL